MKSPILWKIGENEVWMGKEIRELAFAFFFPEAESSSFSPSSLTLTAN